MGDPNYYYNHFHSTLSSQCLITSFFVNSNMDIIPYAENEVLSLNVQRMNLFLKKPFNIMVDPKVITKIKIKYQKTKEIGGLLIGHEVGNNTIQIDDVVILKNTCPINPAKNYSFSRKKIRDIVNEHKEENFIPFLFHTHVLGRYSLSSTNSIEQVINMVLASIYMEPSVEDQVDKNQFKVKLKGGDFYLPEMVLTFSDNLEIFDLVYYDHETRFSFIKIIVSQKRSLISIPIEWVIEKIREALDWLFDIMEDCPVLGLLICFGLSYLAYQFGKIVYRYRNIAYKILRLMFEGLLFFTDSNIHLEYGSYRPLPFNFHGSIDNNIELNIENVEHNRIDDMLGDLLNTYRQSPIYRDYGSMIEASRVILIGQGYKKDWVTHRDRVFLYYEQKFDINWREGKSFLFIEDRKGTHLLVFKRCERLSRQSIDSTLSSTMRKGMKSVNLLLNDDCYISYELELYLKDNKIRMIKYNNI